MKIGIFDSGQGGHIVARQLQSRRPHDTFTVVDDIANVPYGSRPAAEIRSLTDLAIQPLLHSCDIIVIACNTATAVAIDTLRQKYPHVPFVGFEPMVKSAVTHSQSGVIAVLATPATLASERYQQLKTTYADQATILEPDCRDWAARIEANTFEPTEAQTIARKVVQQGADVIVLACTHYLLLEPAIHEAVKSTARVLQPLDAINAQINRLSVTAGAPQ